MGQFKDKIVVRWSKVNGAAGYLVYRYANSKWETIGETVTESLEDAPAERDKRYYTVIAKE